MRTTLLSFAAAVLAATPVLAEDEAKIHAAQINPLGGINLFANRNIFLSVAVGYMVPLSRLEQLRGPRVRAGLNFSFW